MLGPPKQSSDERSAHKSEFNQLEQAHLVVLKSSITAWRILIAFTPSYWVTRKRWSRPVRRRCIPHYAREYNYGSDAVGRPLKRHSFWATTLPKPKFPPVFLAGALSLMLASCSQAHSSKCPQALRVT